MIFKAYPHKGVNDIEFGMTSAMVGERMTGRLEIGDIRATSKDHPTYSYPDVPVFFYFDGEGYLDSIEFCRGADVLLGGINFLNLPVREALSALQRLDPDMVMEVDGAKSRALDLALWCPNLDEEDDEEPVETLLIGAPGYYKLIDTP
jgi:hypothetical protein